MNGIWCRKIGMTQVFEENGVLTPVTVCDASDWFVLRKKTVASDGNNAIQIGLLREKHQGKAFSEEWKRSLPLYFEKVVEVPIEAELIDQVTIGELVDPVKILTKGDYVDISAVTIGKGFQGGVKRHGFSGGRGSHGDKLGRKPGSMGFMRSRGRVIKGWRMAGRMGGDKRTIRRLRVVAMDQNNNQAVIIVKGSVPGKTGSLLFLHKCK